MFVPCQDARGLNNCVVWQVQAPYPASVREIDDHALLCRATVGLTCVKGHIRGLGSVRERPLALMSVVREGDHWRAAEGLHRLVLCRVRDLSEGALVTCANRGRRVKA